MTHKGLSSTTIPWVQNKGSKISKKSDLKYFRTADDRLQGKELDSLKRYKERRKKRIQETNIANESDSSIHG